jgi:acetyl coenzyme A synthetase (ADP forming)-like protein
MEDATRNETDGLSAVFRPKTVAVIGASRKDGSIGREIMRNLIFGDFTGTVYPVNPHGGSVFGVRVFASVRDIPDSVELAVVVVPAANVLSVVDECGQKGVKGLVIITAGFREIGGEGVILEERLKELLAKYGMRAVGPNCMGLCNSDPRIRLNVTFSSARMREGDIAFVSQSGALGMAILDMADDLGLGLAYFVSLGNKVNISGNDLLMEWENDTRVRLILMYLENFGNPRRFVELARRIGARKPIIVVKSGRTGAGARAARSHTGALAEPNVLTEALLEQCGVLRAQTIEELFEYARLFSKAPVPKGNRVGIVTNSGGPGILATDALAESRLVPAVFSPETTDELKRILPPVATTGNPADMTAHGGPAEYEASVRTIMKDPKVDAGIVIFTPPTIVQEEAVANAILNAREPTKPLLACVLKSSQGSPAYRMLSEANLPTYTFPESAVRALSGYYAYARWQMQDKGRIPEFADVNVEEAGKLIREVIVAGREWLEPDDGFALISHLGIRSPRSRFASTEAAVGWAVREAGFPAVLKAQAKGLIHKADIGGVRLNIRTLGKALEAFREMKQAVTERGLVLDGVLVQEQVPADREVIVGANVDPNFGPLLMFGLGGKYVEVLRDVVFRLAPLSDRDAERMVQAIRGYPILEGVRREKRSDIRGIESALLRLSFLVMRFPQIAEIEINPLVVQEEGSGVIALDVRVKLWPQGEAPRAPAVVPEITLAGP